VNRRLAGLFSAQAVFLDA